MTTERPGSDAAGPVASIPPSWAAPAADSTPRATSSDRGGLPRWLIGPLVVFASGAVGLLVVILPAKEPASATQSPRTAAVPPAEPAPERPAAAPDTLGAVAAAVDEDGAGHSAAATPATDDDILQDDDDDDDDVDGDVAATDGALQNGDDAAVVAKKKKAKKKTESARRPTTAAKKKRAAKLLARARTAADAGKWKSAASTLERVVLLDPNFAMAWRDLGIARAKLQNTDGARAAYQTYIDLAPDAKDAPDVRRILGE